MTPLETVIVTVVAYSIIVPIIGYLKNRWKK